MKRKYKLLKDIFHLKEGQILELSNDGCPSTYIKSVDINSAVDLVFKIDADVNSNGVLRRACDDVIEFTRDDMVEFAKFVKNETGLPPTGIAFDYEIDCLFKHWSSVYRSSNRFIPL